MPPRRRRPKKRAASSKVVLNTKIIELSDGNDDDVFEVEDVCTKRQPKTKQSKIFASSSQSKTTCQFKRYKASSTESAKIISNDKLDEAVKHVDKNSDMSSDILSIKKNNNEIVICETDKSVSNSTESFIDCVCEIQKKKSFCF